MLGAYTFAIDFAGGTNSTKPGRTTVKHSDKDIPPKILKSIKRQSELRFR